MIIRPCFEAAKEMGLPLVVDADGLYLVTNQLGLVHGYTAGPCTSPHLSAAPEALFVGLVGWGFKLSMPTFDKTDILG